MPRRTYRGPARSAPKVRPSEVLLRRRRITPPKEIYLADESGTLRLVPVLDTDWVEMETLVQPGGGSG